MPKVTLQHVSKSFRNVKAVINLSLDIKDEEFVTLLGPSGCGKTTTLRIIAGLESPDEGQIYIGDKLVNDLPPKDRNIAMVFQNYALYPHMSVRENLAFPLKATKTIKGEIEKRVKSVSDLLGIEDLLERYPRQLSGGQQQRVALGRALVREPEVFLLDEPLSNLDAKLRIYMRTEVKKIQRSIGITTIYVTHDQVEAMSMSDRIAVLNEGKLQQFDSPQRLYFQPANMWVGGFIGSPPMNFLEGTLRIEDEGGLLETDYFTLELLGKNDLAEGSKGSFDIFLGVRPEDIIISRKKVPNFAEAKVYMAEPLGAETIVDFEIGGNVLKAKSDSSFDADVGEKIYVGFKEEKIHFFDKNTKERFVV